MIEFNTPKEEQLLALINGLQQNLLTLAMQMDTLHVRLMELEKQHAEISEE